MNIKERIAAVYRGETPDQVPFMLDLSHWFYHKHKIPWDLSKAYEIPEYELIDYHKKLDVGFYMPNLGSFFKISYPDDVHTDTHKSSDGQSITWTIETPLGTIQRERLWEETTYSWGIAEWGVKTEEQLKILAYAYSKRTFEFYADKYKMWVDYIGDNGVCYIGSGYSAMGQLLGYWMGIEGTTFASFDWPETVKEVVDTINANNLELIKVIADSPVEYVCMGDNFSSDVQPPYFFNQWSGDYYTKAIAILHSRGKKVAVHVDGMLKGAIKMIAETGADCIDATTPKPMGDLTPDECRSEAGNDLILSGGVSPDLWLPNVDIKIFKNAVLEWLDLKKRSSRLIANAGDQVPPGAVEDRIKIMRDLVAEYGQY